MTMSSATMTSMPSRQDLEEQCLRRINECWEQARQRYGAIALPAHLRPVVEFTQRGAQAGSATVWRSSKSRDLTRSVIKLNPVLLREQGDAFIRRAPGHEVAHVVAYVLSGGHRMDHGPEWQRIMREFGQPPIRCHSFDTKNTKIKRRSAAAKRRSVACYCTTIGCCRKYMITEKLAANFRKGNGRLSCPNCKQFNVVLAAAGVKYAWDAQQRCYTEQAAMAAQESVQQSTMGLIERLRAARLAAQR